MILYFIKYRFIPFSKNDFFSPEFIYFSVFIEKIISHIMSEKTLSLSSSPRIFRFTIFIAGSSGTGKTTCMSRLKSGGYTPNHDPTFRFHREIITFFTTDGDIISFTVVEYAGNLVYEGHLQHPYDRYDGGIIMMNAEDFAKSQMEGEIMEARLTPLIFSNIPPIFRCINRMDVQENYSYPYTSHHMSAKTGVNIVCPFLYLAMKLTRNPNVRFHQTPMF
jgi:hypothetical protein